VQKVMSAIPPKADMCGALAHVRFVPIADISQISAPMKIERPPRGCLSENSITFTRTSAALLMLHHDLGAGRHARIKIDHIVVDQPEAT
jgi:hypothetical protein